MDEKSVLLKLDREKYDALKAKLAKAGNSFTGWVRELIEAELAGFIIREGEASGEQAVASEQVR